ncbi:hypothetical protein EDD18DRAFT_1131269 [Armillaria luteobubalina]|uniref:Secreted protein n=1 Tax=Armillaria luteobubalina TaxID=153913 RepID=A0AA39QJ54_9AGAR|nr:hypothetical protein EDD18DRAFT_1131269 [Armillaria luteobubalina]
MVFSWFLSLSVLTPCQRNTYSCHVTITCTTSSLRGEPRTCWRPTPTVLTDVYFCNSSEELDEAMTFQTFINHSRGLRQCV